MRRTSRLAAAPILAVAVTIALAATACGRGGDDPATTTTPPATGGTADGQAGGDGTDAAGSEGTAAGTTPGTRIPGPRPAEVADLEVVLSGFSVVGTGKSARATYGIVYKNPNRNWIARDVRVDVSFTNGFGVEVATDTFTAAAVPPDTESAAGQAIPAAGAIKMTASFSTGSWEQTDKSWPPFEVSLPEIDTASANGTTFTATVTSPYKVTLKRPTIVAIAVNGIAIVGGDASPVSGLARKRATKVKVVLRANFKEVSGGRIFVIPAELPEP